MHEAPVRATALVELARVGLDPGDHGYLLVGQGAVPYLHQPDFPVKPVNDPAIPKRPADRERGCAHNRTATGVSESPGALTPAAVPMWVVNWRLGS